jgi:hypothetical protein
LIWFDNQTIVACYYRELKDGAGNNYHIIDGIKNYVYSQKTINELLLPFSEFRDSRAIQLEQFEFSRRLSISRRRKGKEDTILLYRCKGSYLTAYIDDIKELLNYWVLL